MLKTPKIPATPIYTETLILQNYLFREQKTCEEKRSKNTF